MTTVLFLGKLLWKYRTYAGIGLALIGGWWWHSVQLTKAYEKGAREKQEALLKDEGRRLEEEREKIIAQLAQDRLSLDAAREAMETERAALQSQRRAITQELNRGIATITERENVIRTEILSVPDADLVPAIRAVLPTIRSAESGRAANR